MKTRRVMFPFICLLFIFTTSVAAGEKKKQNSLQKGAWAMLFEISGSLMDFRVTDYLGSTFSGKYHFSDNRALRFGVEIDGSMVEIDRDINTVYEGTSTHAEYVEYYVHRFRSVFHYLWYLPQESGFSAFLGFGPFFDLDFMKKNFNRETESTGPSGETGTTVESNYRDNNYYAGLSGAIGVEYFIGKSFSAILEYQSNAGYTYYVRKNDMNSSSHGDVNVYPKSQSDKRTSRSFRYGGSHVKIGISVYF